MDNIGIYIHIPFCRAKCYYCDFTSFAGKENIIDRYIDNLIGELGLYKDKVKDKKIYSIFIGGGTPSHIDEKHIVRIMKFIRENFNVDDLEEASIEINPGTLDKNKAQAYKDAGINRASMGVQTLNPDHLKKIGRIHDEKQVYESYETLRRAGFDNINLDFIFGLPDETIEDVSKNLDLIEEIKPEHISYYGLILEEGTVLYKLEGKGELNIPSDEKEREMYYLIKKRLKSMGYLHYEISNFSLRGRECKHNVLYWNILPYIGVGLSSHSYYGGKRYWNHDNFQDYFKAIDKGELPIEGEEKSTLKDEISEFAIMGLRFIDGIDKQIFRDRFGKSIEYYYKEAIKDHIEDGLLEENERSIKLTDKGLDLSNKVEVDFLLE
nr:radical SAM family heme chaperone HemW [Tissierella sp.]